MAEESERSEALPRLRGETYADILARKVEDEKARRQRAASQRHLARTQVMRVLPPPAPRQSMPMPLWPPVEPRVLPAPAGLPPMPPPPPRPRIVVPPLPLPPELVAQPIISPWYLERDQIGGYLNTHYAYATLGAEGPCDFPIGIPHRLGPFGPGADTMYRMLWEAVVEEYIPWGHHRGAGDDCSRLSEDSDAMPFDLSVLLATAGAQFQSLKCEVTTVCAMDASTSIHTPIRVPSNLGTQYLWLPESIIDVLASKLLATVVVFPGVSPCFSMLWDHAWLRDLPDVGQSLEPAVRQFYLDVSGRCEETKDRIALEIGQVGPFGRGPYQTALDIGLRQADLKAGYIVRERVPETVISVVARLQEDGAALYGFLCSTLFQLTHALEAASNVLGFVHGNLSVENVHVKRLDADLCGRVWLFKGPTYWTQIPPADHRGYLIKISDLGSAAVIAKNTYIPDAMPWGTLTPRIATKTFRAGTRKIARFVEWVVPIVSIAQPTFNHSLDQVPADMGKYCWTLATRVLTMQMYDAMVIGTSEAQVAALFALMDGWTQHMQARTYVHDNATEISKLVMLMTLQPDAGDYTLRKIRRGSMDAKNLMRRSQAVGFLRCLLEMRERSSWEEPAWDRVIAETIIQFLSTRFYTERTEKPLKTSAMKQKLEKVLYADYRIDDNTWSPTKGLKPVALSTRVFPVHYRAVQPKAGSRCALCGRVTVGLAVQKTAPVGAGANLTICSRVCKAIMESHVDVASPIRITMQLHDHPTDIAPISPEKSPPRKMQRQTTCCE